VCSQKFTVRGWTSTRGKAPAEVATGGLEVSTRRYRRFFLNKNKNMFWLKVLASKPPPELRIKESNRSKNEP